MNKPTINNLVLILGILIITVCFKNGTIVKYPWAQGYYPVEHWNKVVYHIYEVRGERRKIDIPAENILWIGTGSL